MPDLISSVSNPRIKQLVALRDRRDRERLGLMLVEGLEEWRVALNSGATLRSVYECPERLPDTPLAREVRALALQQTGEHIVLSATAFEKAAYREDPVGLLGVFATPSHALDALPVRDEMLVLVMEGVEKPGNIGAMLRTADAAGVDAVLVCAPDGQPLADMTNPNLVRASKGSCFALPIAVANNDAALVWLQARGARITAASPQGKQAFTRARLTGATALVVGEEARGLSPFWLQRADQTVLIPMHGTVNSLNVSVSAALLMYEAERQRRK